MKYKKPISVIMPVYQGERFIRQAVLSILDQTFEDFELIIVNDGSTDRTTEIVRCFRDQRIKYLRTEHSNNYCARNLGMSISIGKYICMMDADDVSKPNRLEEQFGFLEAYRNVAGIGSEMEIIDEKEVAMGDIKMPLSYPMIKTWLLKNNVVAQPTLMFRSHLFKKHRFLYNKSFTYAGDYDFVARICQNFEIRNLEKALVRYRRHSEQISARKKYQQTKFADEVREYQLRAFGIEVTPREVGLHLKLMKDRYICDEDLRKSEEWLNRLLVANHKKKIYPSAQLYRLFENTLATALRTNALGGWSLDKDTLLYIEDNLTKGSHILEFGSGRGTDALLNKYRVTSVEHDERYVYRREKNHTIVHAPITDGWYSKNVLRKIMANKFDLIIIDGPPGELRSGLTKNIELFSNVSIPIIFDDMGRELDKKVMETFCSSMDYEFKLFRGKIKKYALCLPIKSALKWEKC